MKGDVQICATRCSAAADYAMNSGFYLIQLQKMIAVVLQFINRLVHVSQGRVTLLLLERGMYLWLPSFGKLFEGADIHVAVVKERCQLGHVLHEKPSILPNRIAAHGRAIGGDVLL